MARQTVNIDVAIGGHPRVRALPVEERWAFVAGVLALAGAAPTPGLLVGLDGEPLTPEQVALQAGVSVEAATGALRKLHQFGTITAGPGGARLASWQDWNPPVRASDLPEATRARKRAERARKRAEAEQIRSGRGRPQLELDERTDVTRLCHLLAEMVRANDPKARVEPDDSKWRDSMRLLLDKDGRSVDEVERAIRWALTDEFWRAIVLTPRKLRRNFDQVWQRMRATPVRPVGGATTDRPLDPVTRRVVERARDAGQELPERLERKLAS